MFDMLGGEFMQMRGTVAQNFAGRFIVMLGQQKLERDPQSLSCRWVVIAGKGFTGLP